MSIKSERLFFYILTERWSRWLSFNIF